MKTRNILAAMIIAACTFSASSIFAQTQQPAIHIFPSGEFLKLAYAHTSKGIVLVEFYDGDGSLGFDRVNASKFEKGFMKRYQLRRDSKSDLWVKVSNAEVSVRFKITPAANGRWASEVETVTYTNPIAQR